MHELQKQSKLLTFYHRSTMSQLFRFVKKFSNFRSSGLINLLFVFGQTQ